MTSALVIPVIFEEENGGNLSDPLVCGRPQYYVVATTATTISVSATKGGAASASPVMVAQAQLQGASLPLMTAVCRRLLSPIRRVPTWRL